MRMLFNFLGAAVATASLSTAALAVESTFMQSTQLSATRIVTYTPGAGSSTLSIVGTVASGNPMLAVGLAWLLPAYAGPPKLFMPVDLVFTATSFSPVVSTGVQFEQPDFDGTMTYSWFDPMLGVTVNLLTVVFTDATLNVDFGPTPSGSFFDTHPMHSVSYTSDVFDVSGFSEADFALGFSAISKAFAIKSGYGDVFQGNVASTFAGGVPEPATWAMLIVGFGMVGFAARRRKPHTSVSA